MYFRLQANCNCVWAYLELDINNPVVFVISVSTITYIAGTKCMNCCGSVIYRLGEFFGVILEDIDMWQLEKRMSASWR